MALKGPSIESRLKFFAISSAGAPWLSGHLTHPEAFWPSGSGSSKHIETVYTHINQLDENHLSADSGLLTMVLSFGQERHAALAQADGRTV